jgi:hypothetical protein
MGGERRIYARQSLLLAVGSGDSGGVEEVHVGAENGKGKEARES